MMVPFVIFSKSLNRLISKSITVGSKKHLLPPVEFDTNLADRDSYRRGEFCRSEHVSRSRLRGLVVDAGVDVH